MTITPIATMKLQSITITATGPVPNAPAKARRPASHGAVSTIKGKPRFGCAPFNLELPIEAASARASVTR